MTTNARQTAMGETGAREFYDREFASAEYAKDVGAEEHSAFNALRKFIEGHELDQKRCLEVGCGRGVFQDLVADYTGCDISSEAGRFLRKPFRACDAGMLPFPNASFDAVWSIYMLEHIAEPEKALSEFLRVLKPGGVMFLWPAWNCRPWAANGYQVRPWRDLDWKGKLIKASIPLRDSLVYRAALALPVRAWTLALHVTGRRDALKFSRLTPNYTRIWQADSDAVSSIDPFSVILWMRSRGADVINARSFVMGLLFRTGPLEIKKAG